MGLTIRAKGLLDEHSYDCGYITFTNFRIAVAKAYNQEFGELFQKNCYNWFEHKFTKDDLTRIIELANDDLDIFLEHSDYDGKMTPQECRKVYSVIKDLSVEMIGHNYGAMENYNMLEQWKNIFKHCYTRRVNLYFL